MSKITIRDFTHTCEKPLSVLFFFLYSMAVLYYFSASSPKLNFNPCPSPNMYLTIGQAMFDGCVPYRDLFDGKGMPVFFFNGLGGLINGSGYWGQWLVTCGFFTWTLYYMNRTAQLFLDRALAVAATLLTSFLLLSGGRMYITGAMGDEFTLPMIMMSIYYFLCLQPEQQQKGKIFALGVLAGLLLSCKFTLASFWFVLFGCHLLQVWNKQGVKAATVQSMIALGGIVCSIAPCIIYYACNNALDSYAYGYFEFHTYHASMPFGERIGYMKQGAMDFLDYTAIMSIGLFYWTVFPLRQYSSWIMRLSIPAACIILYAAVYAGACFIYYYLSMMPFVLFGVIYLIKELTAPASCKRRLLSVLLLAACVFLTTRSTSLLLAGRYENESCTLPAIMEKKANLRKIADAIIKENPHPSILCYGCFDNGIYRMLGIIPDVTHYQLVNFDPKGKKAQQQYVKERRNDYIFISTEHLSGTDLQQAQELLEQNGYTPMDADLYRNTSWILYKKAASLAPVAPEQTSL